MSILAAIVTPYFRLQCTWLFSFRRLRIRSHVLLLLFFHFGSHSALDGFSLLTHWHFRTQSTAGPSNQIVEALLGCVITHSLDIPSMRYSNISFSSIGTRLASIIFSWKYALNASPFLHCLSSNCFRNLSLFCRWSNILLISSSTSAAISSMCSGVEPLKRFIFETRSYQNFGTVII